MTMISKKVEASIDVDLALIREFIANADSIELISIIRDCIVGVLMRPQQVKEVFDFTGPDSRDQFLVLVKELAKMVKQEA